MDVTYDLFQRHLVRHAEQFGLDDADKASLERVIADSSLVHRARERFLEKKTAAGPKIAVLVFLWTHRKEILEAVRFVLGQIREPGE